MNIIKSVQSSAMKGAIAINNGVAALDRKAFAVMGLVGAAALPVSAAFAAGDVFDSATKIIQTIYKGVLGISTILAVVCVVICCLFMMLSSNPKTVETSKGWLKRILIAWVVINALGLIVTSLQSWLKNSGATQYSM